MERTLFEGAYTALVTPFRDGEVDGKALRALVQAQADSGIDGLCPCGTTGESATLSEDEHSRIFDIILDESGDALPVIAGVGTNDTRKSIRLAKRAKESGCHGLLVVVPYYSKPSQDGLEAHFRAIADATDLPVMLYDVPGRSVIGLSVDTLIRLADVSHIVAIKDATGNITRAQKQFVAIGDRIKVLSGDDGLTLAMMAVGASGVVSVTSNVFPVEVAEVVRLAREGRWDAARMAHLRLLPVHEAMFAQPNPGPVKALLASRGMLVPEVRLPLVWTGQETLTHVESALASASLEFAK